MRGDTKIFMRFHTFIGTLNFEKFKLLLFFMRSGRITVGFDFAILKALRFRISSYY